MYGVILLIVSFLALSVTLGAQGHLDSVPQEKGLFCIAAIPKLTSGEKSLANPTGGDQVFGFSVQVDELPLRHISYERSFLIDALDRNGPHWVKIFRGSSLAESFEFTFANRGSNKLCLWFTNLGDDATLLTLQCGRQQSIYWQRVMER